MDAIRETFNKSERLCSVKIISKLFEEGNVFHNSIFKVVWDYSPANLPWPAQVAFSVSKRGFRHAVTRNLIKRRMREAYRKNKHPLYEHLVKENKQIVSVIILRGNSVPDFPAVEKAMVASLKKLIALTEVRSLKSEVQK